MRKSQLLDSLLRWVAVAGAIAYLPSLYASLISGLHLLAFIDTVGYLAVLLIVVNRRAGYQVRLFTMVGLSLFLGAAVLFSTGNDGAGHLWLLCAVFIAALFGSRSIIVLAIVTTQAVMILYLALIAGGVLGFSESAVSIVAISANMLLISMALAFVTLRLLRSLRDELARQEEVLRHLHHRVRNTLQTVESLIGIEAETEDGAERSGRRIRAVLSANELIVDEILSEKVDLGELLRVISPARVAIETRVPYRIAAERCVEIAVGFSDLLAVLEPYGPIELTIEDSVRVRTAKPLPEPEKLSKASGIRLLPALTLECDSDGKDVLKVGL